MDKNLNTVAFIVTRINSPEAARVWAAEKHKQEVREATLQGILERIESKVKASRASAEYFEAERNEAARKVASTQGTILEAMHAYTEGSFEAKRRDCVDEANWLDQLAKDLRQVLATPTKAI